MTNKHYHRKEPAQSSKTTRMIPPTDGMNMPEAAEAWAAAGWRPIPASSEKAVPRMRWSEVDGISPAQARKMFERYSHSRLCIILPADVVVLDIDHRPEEKGWDADQIFARLCKRYRLPECPVCLTPRSGMHLWYRLPAGVTGKNWTAANKRFPIDGVDIRTSRGLATVPPSKRTAGDYRWAEPLYTLPLAPAELCADLMLPPLRINKQVSLLKMSTRQASAYVEKAFRAEVDRVRTCGRGGRNVQLFKSAAALGSLVASGAISTLEVRQALLNAAKECGLFRDDGASATLATIESGLKAGAQNPRRVPRSVK